MRRGAVSWFTWAHKRKRSKNSDRVQSLGLYRLSPQGACPDPSTPLQARVQFRRGEKKRAVFLGGARRDPG